MKLKLNLGEAGIKEFFVQHAEKIVLGVVLLGVAWLVTSGTKQKLIDDRYSPEAIQAQATNAQSHINNPDTWKQVEEYRFKTPTDFEGRVQLALVKVNNEQYEMPVPLSTLLFPPDIKRTDPTLYPPEQPEVSSGYGALLVRSGGAAPAGGAGGSGSAGATPVGVYFVSLKLLVPVRKQQAEYRRCFLNAAGYNPSRDKPTYGILAATGKRYVYALERMELKPDGTDGVWSPLAYSIDAEAAAAKWAGYRQETAATEFVDQNLFTQPVPPMPLTDLTDLVMHARHSKAPDRRLQTAKDKTPAADPTPAAAAPGGPLGPGAGPLGGATQQQSEVEEEATGSAQPSSSFKMLRYFDFSVQPGKVYKYRAILYLEDANDPQEVERRPKVRTLDKSVIDRIAAKPKDASGNRRHWLPTDPSEPSPPVSVSEPSYMLGSQITLGKKTKLPNGAEVPRGNDTARLMVLEWNQRDALNIPGETEVERGTVLDFVADATVIDPLSRKARTLSGHSFETGGLVLDFNGGTSLPGKDRRNLQTAPSEILVLDGDGKLQLLNEASDFYLREKFGGVPGGGEAAKAEDPTPAGAQPPADAGGFFGEGK